MKPIKKINHLNLIFMVFLFYGGLCSCIKTNFDGPVQPAGSILDLKVSPDFKFITTKTVATTLSTLDNTGAPVPGMKVSVYTDLPSKGGSLIMSGITGVDGVFSFDLKLPSTADSVAIGTNAIGFVNMQKVRIQGSALNFVLGGRQQPASTKRSATAIFSATSAVYKPLGTYNTDGVPNYLEPKNDVIDATMLADINATLPETKALTSSHPQYLTETNEANLVLVDECNVWVTFVHEGAGYKNVLAFYTYPKGQAPASVNDIKELNIIFPNISFSGSGGGLASGNKVFIGTFPPNIEIGWAIIANGYNNGTISSGLATYYSDIQLNPESTNAKKKHTILLNDIGRSEFLLSFEDLNRDQASDNDFNDAVFYVTANPVSAVDVTDVPLPDYTATDTDKDGVPDNFDDYPDDPSKAFNNYFPSEGNHSTLAFEDTWPHEGDYDMNDLVADYNFNQITNGKNQVVQIKADITVKAAGAMYKNGFGIRFPIKPEGIASVKGTDPSLSPAYRSANGTEPKQSMAVLILFSDAFRLLPYPGSAIGVNTTPGAPYVDPRTLNLTIDLSTPVTLGSIGAPPYNPFIFSNGRGREVHLIDNLPTDLADTGLFGTGDDNSIPEKGRYYVTPNNLPFAIDIANAFEYPVENKMITDAYLKFYEWAVSSGLLSYDWYKADPGYRNAGNIYSR